MTVTGTLNYAFDDGVLTVDTRGRYTVDAYLALMDRALSDPACPRRVCVLVDSSHTGVVRRPDEMRQVADHLAGFSGRITALAVLAPRDVHFGLTRIAAARGEAQGLLIEAFRDRNEALAWLGACAQEHPRPPA
jgi:hypothetical protein